ASYHLFLVFLFTFALAAVTLQVSPTVLEHQPNKSVLHHHHETNWAQDRELSHKEPSKHVPRYLPWESGHLQKRTPPGSPHSRTGVILPTLLIFGLVVFGVVVLVIDLTKTKPVSQPVELPEPEEQQNLVLCNSDNVQYEYK